MSLDPQRFREAGHAALHDAGLRTALGRLKTHFAHGRAQAVARYDGWEDLREQGRAIRDYALSHLDTLLETFEWHIIARGGQVHWARDAREGREIVLGTVTQPWIADVVFRAVSPDAFAAFDEPGYVKIVCTLRADPISAAESVFRTETRVEPTDPTAREKFRKYWSLVSPGIVLIRLMSLKRLKAEAERRTREGRVAA